MAVCDIKCVYYFGDILAFDVHREREREIARAKIKIKVLVVNALQCAGAYKCVLSSAALVSINETTFSLSVS